jgi:hypothetical protein
MHAAVQAESAAYGSAALAAKTKALIKHDQAQQ